MDLRYIPDILTTQSISSNFVKNDINCHNADVINIIVFTTELRGSYIYFYRIYDSCPPDSCPPGQLLNDSCPPDSCPTSTTFAQRDTCPTRHLPTRHLPTRHLPTKTTVAHPTVAHPAVAHPTVAHPTVAHPTVAHPTIKYLMEGITNTLNN